MNKIFKALLAILFIAFAFTACDKKDALTVFGTGTAPALTASTNTFAPTASDSDKVAVVFNWTDAKYATDSSTEKYIIQIDSAGRNFSKAVSKTIIGKLSASYTNKELNAILLGFGFAFNTAYNIEARVLSSYGNNNEQYKSNSVAIKATAYVTPPKIMPPTSGHLYLVGNASQGGWGNPVPVPTQEFAKLDSVTYGGVFNLNGGNEYLLLPVNGSWDHKYSVNDKNVTGLAAGGDFGYDLSSNFPAPATSGWYTMIFSFQTGKFTVTPYTGNLPTNLFIVGNATLGGWTNPVPLPSQQFNRINSSVFELSLPLNGGKEYLLLPVNGSWDHKYAVADKSVPGLSAGGSFGYDLGQNFPGPANSGTYKISVNFVTGKFSVK
ncbi:MAG: SusE domain-containing protein [Bacteroidetes bacterium]|nr:SusE domain-containing protein [Bacteroidota bacterium]